MIVPLYKAQCMYRGNYDDNFDFKLEFITNQLSEKLQKVKASHENWEKFLYNWATPVWNDESFMTDLSFEDFKDVIITVKVLKDLFSNMEEQIKFQLVEALKNEYVPWSNTVNDAELCKLICDPISNQPVRGERLTEKTFSRLVSKIRENGSMFRPQPYRFLYAIPKSGEILYHKVNTKDEHLIDGEHVKFCPGVTFQNEDEMSEHESIMMHPCLLNGAPVWMAGEIQIYMNADSTLDVHVNDASGHYMEQTSGAVTDLEYEGMMKWLRLKFERIVAKEEVTLLIHACGDFPNENCDYVPLYLDTSQTVTRFEKYPPYLLSAEGPNSALPAASLRDTDDVD